MVLKGLEWKGTQPSQQIHADKPSSPLLGESSTSDTRGGEAHHQGESRPPDLDLPRLAPHKTKVRASVSAWKGPPADRLYNRSL